MSTIEIWQEAQPESFWFLVLATGLCLGSFLNVVIYRLSFASQSNLDDWRNSLLGNSRCPSCEAPIPPWLNIPILGWLMIRGRSACCHTKISIQYPLVEFAGMVGAGLIFWLYPAGTAALLTVGYFMVLATMVAYLRHSAFLTGPSIGFFCICSIIALYDPLFGSWDKAVLGGAITIMACMVANQMGRKMFDQKPAPLSDYFLLCGAGFLLGANVTCLAAVIALAAVIQFPRLRVSMAAPVFVLYFFLLVYAGIDKSIFIAILKG